jgi:hypothetical protein
VLLEFQFLTDMSLENAGSRWEEDRTGPILVQVVFLDRKCAADACLEMVCTGGEEGWSEVFLTFAQSLDIECAVDVGSGKVVLSSSSSEEDWSKVLSALASSMDLGRVAVVCSEGVGSGEEGEAWPEVLVDLASSPDLGCCFVVCSVRVAGGEGEED